MNAKRRERTIRYSLIGLAGWLMAAGSAQAVILLPEGYDPDRPNQLLSLNLQEESSIPEPPPAEPSGNETGVRVTLKLHKPEQLPTKKILLNDICDIQTDDEDLLMELAGLEILDVPKPGETTYIYPRRIEAMLRHTGLAGKEFEITGPERIQIEVPSQTIPIERIQEVIETAFQARNHQDGKEHEVEVTVMRQPQPIPLPVGELEIAAQDLDRPGSGIRTVILGYLVDGKQVHTQAVSVRVHETAWAVTAGQDLETGQIIKSQDLVKDQVKILDSSDMPDLVLDPETIIGARLRKAIKSGIPIRQSDLEWIPLRKRGESVTLVKQVGNVRLSIHATLQEDLLRVGQEVKVKMKKSKKEAVGRLLEDGTVLLLSEKS